MKSNKTKYPLRKVMYEHGRVPGEYKGHSFSQLVVLECGHKIPPSRGMYGDTCPVRQRCRLCHEEKIRK